jgi:hypothetical protein
VPRPPNPHPLFATAEARRLAWLCGCALVLGTIALNARVLEFGFLYLRDDDVNVTVNSHMGGLGAARLAWMFTDYSYVRRYIPLGWLGFSATYEFAGLDPAPYHAVGLALCAVNAALVLVAVMGVLRVFMPGREGGLQPWDVAAAALAAGWWALSPLRVETTAWVSGNLYGQAAAFLLASVALYLRTYGRSGVRRAVLLGLSVMAFACSLLTYPIGLGVPVLLAGLDWLYARRHPGAPLVRLLAEKALFALPLAAVLSVTVFARFAGAEVFGSVPGLGDLSLMARAAQSAYVAAYYVWKPWWPLHLSPLYDTLMDFRPSDPVFVLSMAAVLGVTAAAVAWRRSRPALIVAWLGYLACAAPFFGLTEKPHMASDRYGYFLGAILAAVLAAGLARIAARPARLCAAAASLAVLAVLSALTRRQLEVWRNDRVHHQYVAGLVTNPGLLDMFTSRLLILEFMRGDERAASEAVEARLRVDPANASYLKARGIMAEKRTVSPYYGPANLLAIIQEQTGLAFARNGEFREADDHLADALRLDDRFYQAAYDRALVLLDLGRGSDALASFLLSERWAAPALTGAQTRVFLLRLGKLARAQGNAPLGDAAEAALAR